MGVNAFSEGVPAYLVYPNDSFSRMMFEGKMREVMSLTCGYRFMIYLDTADYTPAVYPLSPAFERNEIHYYFKENAPSWYSISTMKHESVYHNTVRGWVETADHMLMSAGMTDDVLRLPGYLQGRRYTGLGIFDLGEFQAYNRIHMLDESHVYAHVFYLDSQLFKKFILLAKRKDWSWRLEVTIPSNYETILQSDFVPPGQTFGMFFVSV